MNRFSREANATTSTPFGGSRPQAVEEDFSGESFAAGSPEDARRLLEEVQHLGSRMRQNRRKAQQIDRRAAAYASRLARHTARLLQHMPNAIPAVRPVPGTGASALRHYILKHDRLDSPERTRLLVVSSDGRLRTCTVLADAQHSRLWNDYEVANPPLGLGLLVVFEGLSSMIVKLETAVGESEAQAEANSSALEGMIAESELKLANAGSRLSPVDPMDDGDNQIEELFGVPDSAGLRSHGFEHRLPFVPEKAGATTPTSAKLASPAAAATPGRFSR